MNTPYQSILSLGSCDDTKFRGELFGLGTNHTKYKGGKYGGGNDSSRGGNGTTDGSTSGRTGQGQQMQYSGQVHYPNNSNPLQMQVTTNY